MRLLLFTVVSNLFLRNNILDQSYITVKQVYIYMRLLSPARP